MAASGRSQSSANVLKRARRSLACASVIPRDRGSTPNAFGAAPSKRSSLAACSSAACSHRWISSSCTARSRNFLSTARRSASLSFGSSLMISDALTGEIIIPVGNLSGGRVMESFTEDQRSSLRRKAEGRDRAQKRALKLRSCRTQTESRSQGERKNKKEELRIKKRLLKASSVATALRAVR